MKNLWKKVALIMSMVLVACSCVACGTPKEQVFTESDFSITLNNRFEKQNVSDVEYMYSAKDAALTVTNMSKQEVKDAGLQITSLNRFAILAMKSYEDGDSAFVREGLNHSYCEVNSVVDGKNMSYYAAFYETDTHYWMVLFGCLQENYADYQASFANWASTVTVK